MPYYGGLTAFLVEENTREALFEAMYDRRVYATAGTRDFLDFRVNGAPMASVVPVGPEAPLLAAEVAAEGPLRAVEVVRGGETVYAAPAAAGEDYVSFSWRDEDYDGAPTYYYLRLTSEDGHLAFATPIWVAGGTWFVGGPAGRPEETWAPGEEKALPTSLSPGCENLALRVSCAADAPGTLTVLAGGQALAALEVPAGEHLLTAFFHAAEERNLRLAYDGPSPLRLREACLFPYPWREPRWIGRRWTYEAGEAEKWYQGRLVADALAAGGRALEISPADALYGRHVLWGPYQILEPGRYTACFALRAEGDPTSPKPAVEISVAVGPAGTPEPPETSTAKVLSVSALAAGGGYKKFALDFELLEKAKCEYKVKYIGNAVVFVDKVEVQQTSYE